MSSSCRTVILSSRAGSTRSTSRERCCASSSKSNEPSGRGRSGVSLKEEVGLLQRIPLFANIEASKLKLLAFTSERVAFEAGHVLFNEGDMGDAAYIIMEGDADVLVASPA